MGEFKSTERTTEIAKSIIKDFEAIEHVANIAKECGGLDTNQGMAITWNHSYAILLLDIAASLSLIADELHALRKENQNE